MRSNTASGSTPRALTDLERVMVASPLTVVVVPELLVDGEADGDREALGPIVTPGRISYSGHSGGSGDALLHLPG
jgi:hypothetical protein